MNIKIRFFFFFFLGGGFSSSIIYEYVYELNLIHFGEKPRNENETMGILWMGESCLPISKKAGGYIASSILTGVLHILYTPFSI